MNVFENTDVFPPRKNFVDVDDKFTHFTKGCRVLPVNYVDDPSLNFTLKAIYQPGDKKTFPNGGVEVYGPEGSVFNYELDQVVVHPYELGMMKYFSKAEGVVKEKIFNGEKKQRGRPRKNPDELKVKPEYKPTGGKRGRPRKNPDEVAEKKQYVPTGGKRGRPPMDPAIKALREQINQSKTKRGRGRPRKSS